MSLMIANALVPVFFVMLLGYFAGKRKIIDNKNVASLNIMLMQFALPLTLFIAIARTSHDVIVSNGPLALVLALSLVIVYLVIIFVQLEVFKLKLGDAAVQTLTIAFPNFASIGLPLLLSVFGKEAALPVAIAIAVGSVTISPLTLASLELHKAKEKGEAGNVSPVAGFFVAVGRSVRKPIFVGPMLGLIVALVGIQLPPLVGIAFMPMTNATAGLGLFLTGLMLSAQPIGIDANVSLGILVKNALQPVLGYVIVKLLGIPEPVASEAVLLLCIPTGFFGLVFGVGYGVRPAVAGSTLVLSSVAAVVSLSVAILVLAPHIG